MMIVANSPDAKVLGYFRPLEKFPYFKTDEDGMPHPVAVYQPKFTYTIRTEELDSMVDQWVAEGKVKRVEV